MKRLAKILMIIMLGITLFVSALPVWAQYGLNQTATNAGLLTEANKNRTIPGIIGDITGAVLSLIGVAFFLLTLYGGLLWMTARGDEAQAKKAQGIIIDAGIGLVIVSAAYIITNFVFTAIKGT